MSQGATETRKVDHRMEKGWSFEINDEMISSWLVFGTAALTIILSAWLAT